MWYYKIKSTLEVPMPRRNLVWMVAFGGLALALTGCPSGKSASPWASTGKPKVLVSFAPLHSFAANVAGDDAEVKCLLPTAGPHFEGEASPQQMDLARTCDVFFINGLGLEDEADGIATKLGKVGGNPKWNVVSLGAKIPEADLMEGEEEHHHGREEKPGHDHPKDPHVWLGIKHAKVMVAGIRDELKRLDPAHAAGYDSRAEAYQKSLDALESEGKAMLAKKTENTILSFHESLNYFGKCYGLEIAGAIEVNPGQEPSSDKLKDIIRLCREKKVRVIAVEPQFPNHTSARVIRDALRGPNGGMIEAEFAEVDPLETCDEKELGPGLYENVMKKNLVELAKVLR
jgi:ABC-type Zn uptake system ZnuABC Zn-binding protein ZnuA